MSQYQVLCEKWRQEFLKIDLEAAVKKFSGLVLTEESLELNYFGEPYTINRETGRIRNEKTGEIAKDFETLMVIYHLLYYSVDKPVLSGEWVSFRQVKTAGVFDGAYQKMVLKPFGEAFSGKLTLLEETVQKLAYPRERYGDISFRVPVFDCLPLIVVFWDGDEEYPAQCNFLFDKNITDFTHPETVVLIAEAVLAKIMKSAGMDCSFVQDER